MEKSKRLVMLGGGGHCSSVLDVAKRMNEFNEIIITDYNMSVGTEIMGCKVVGNDELLPQLFQDGFQMAFITVGSIKDVEKRKNIYQKIKNIGFEMPNIIDPSVIISDYTMLGKGIFIGKNVIINTGTKIEDMAIINTGAIIEHGCYIGRFSHVAVGGVICGDCNIGESVFIGANATVIQGVKIGANSVVGAGSIVLKNMESDSINVGINKIMKRGCE